MHVNNQQSHSLCNIMTPDPLWMSQCSFLFPGFQCVKLLSLFPNQTSNNIKLDLVKWLLLRFFTTKRLDQLFYDL